MDFHKRLTELGLTLPPAPKPVAAYVPSITSCGHIFISGQLPFADGKLLATGAVPSAASVEQAAAAAKQCAINGLAVADAAMGGDWSRFIRVVRIGAFVASDAGFYEQPKVANGASELLGAIFGDAGRHARAAVGVNVLPLNATVEVEMILAVRE